MCRASPGRTQTSAPETAPTALADPPAQSWQVWAFLLSLPLQARDGARAPAATILLAHLPVVQISGQGGYLF